MPERLLDDLEPGAEGVRVSDDLLDPNRLTPDPALLTAADNGLLVGWDDDRDEWVTIALGDGEGTAPRFVQLTDTWYIDVTAFPRVEALPDEAAHNVGDIVNLNGEPWVLVDEGDDSNIHRGTAGDLGGGYWGDATFSWSVGGQQPEYRLYVPRTLAGASPPADLNAHFQHTDGTQRPFIQVDRASGSDTSTLYAYTASNTDDSITSQAGDFTIRVSTDGVGDSPYNIQADDRWEKLLSLNARGVPDAGVVAQVLKRVAGPGNPYSWQNERVARVLAGGSIQVERDGDDYTVSADFETHAGNLALGEHLLDLTTTVTQNASTSSSVFNLPQASDEQLYIRTKVGNEIGVATPTKGELRNLAAGAVGGRTGDHLVVGGLRLYRSAQETLLYSLDATAGNQSVDIDIWELEADGVLSTEGMPAPIYQQLAAQVALPVGASNDEWNSAWTEVWRYTNTDAAQRHYLISASLNPYASWAARNGADRGGVQFRVVERDGSDADVRTLATSFGYVRNGNSPYVALSAHASLSTPVVARLAQNEYVIIEARANAQNVTPAPVGDTDVVRTGGRNSVVLDTGDNDFWVQELVATQAAATTGQQQAGETSTGNREWWLYQRAAAGITPVFTGMRYNGARWIGPWTPGIPPGTDPLWITLAYTYRAPGSADGYGVSPGFTFPEAHVQYSAAPPFDDAHTTFAPATDNWRRFYEGNGNFGAWREVDPQGIVPFLNWTGGHWYPLSRASTQRLSGYPRMGLGEVTEMFIHLGCYANGDLSQTIAEAQFFFSPRHFVAPVPRTDTPTVGRYTRQIVLDRSGNHPRSYWGKNGITRNEGASQYGFYGCNVEFHQEPPPARISPLMADSLMLYNPISFDGQRRYAMDVSVYWR